MQATEGYILNFRLGGNRQYPREAIIEILGVKEMKDVYPFINRKVVWTTPTGKKIIGKIVKPHGRRGRVIAVFRKGLPGQAVGTKVKIL
ncbi:MAG: 50S ribosomal protein L35ae [Thermoproteales archaeon]|nr:50S ribosomal protein L35ae [Thermoproteales archaeon]RLE64286.1 MAG: 50S ribosomal protein L35ae [Thermoprotei archaeon]